MAKIVSVNSDVKGDICSVRLLVGTSDKSDNSIWYLERPVNKLVVLVENEDRIEYEFFGWFDSPSRSLLVAICQGVIAMP